MAETFRTGLLNAVLRALEGLLVSCAAALLLRLGAGICFQPQIREWAWAKLVQLIPTLAAIHLITIAVAASIWGFARFRKTALQARVKLPPDSSITTVASSPLRQTFTLTASLLLSIGVLFVVIAVPTLAVYLALEPANYPRGIRVSVLLLSAGVGLLYYHWNRHRIRGPVAVISYFAAVCTGPAGVVMILL